MRYFFHILHTALWLLLFINGLMAQAPKKQVNASRIYHSPKIDGILDEPEWSSAALADDFFQYDPYNDRKSSLATSVKFLFDNEALYIGAMMYDDHPDSILTELGFRDSEYLNADHVKVDICAFNDGQNALIFGVTASGIQMDSKYIGGDDDDTWNAVWISDVKILSNGWSAEMKIPYSALRFPEKDEQTWGMNIWRNIRRTREIDSWNFVDKMIEGTVKQAGELTGLRDIKPVLRLSFVPYVSGYLEKKADNPEWGYYFNYGMDLKYGLNESFTLDMTLIPDFGQVQSDDEIYNLTPFEVYYEEKRPFFTEGTELFRKGDVFYSRRVGDVPDLYHSVEDSLKEGEFITENPTKTKLINATKFSGRTNKGLGIGVFNAMSAAAHATISDSSGNLRYIETQPFTNYNMVILDQNLKNNSYVSLYNSNVFKGEEYDIANVSGTEFQLFNRSSSYSLFGRVNLSQDYHPDTATDLGYHYNLIFSKTSGRFRFSLTHFVESEKYDPNDLGFNESNNEYSNSVTLNYNYYDPWWIFLNWNNSVSVWHQSLYVPRMYTDFGIYANSRATLRNYLTLYMELDMNPVDQHDYYEARVPGKVFVRPPKYEIGGFISPDYRKPFIIDLRGNIELSPEYDQQSFMIGLMPRWRVNDKLTFKANVLWSEANNDIGYVDRVSATGSDEIIFGRRDLHNVENILQTSYMFTNKLALDFRLRHYWLKAVYDKFYSLDEHGYLSETDYKEDNDFNFNAFNIDFILRWEFAPGSELAIAWKNAILTMDETEVTDTYFENLNNTLRSPADNSFSVRLLYYLDYQYFKKSGRKEFQDRP